MQTNTKKRIKQDDAFLVRMSKEQRHILKLISKKEDLPQSEIVRRAVKLYGEMMIRQHVFDDLTTLHEIYPGWMTIKEMETISKKTRSTIYRWMDSGILDMKKIGVRVMVRYNENSKMKMT